MTVNHKLNAKGKDTKMHIALFHLHKFEKQRTLNIIL